MLISRTLSKADLTLVGRVGLMDYILMAPPLSITWTPGPGQGRIHNSGRRRSWPRRTDSAGGLAQRRSNPGGFLL